jgi:hypothetical protein
MRQYRGVTIERTNSSGMYLAYPDCGKHNDHMVRVMADDLVGIKVMIAGVLVKGCGFAGYGSY